MKNRFEALREASKQKIEVVTAPLLYPTPPAVAARMVELLDLKPDHIVLEPSAGTGALLEACINKLDGRFEPAYFTAIEINSKLALILGEKYERLFVFNEDFLSVEPNQIDDALFDRIIMNPPFNNGADIKHIEHALKFLKSGGTLVAICANGPRQNDKLKPMAWHWERLPSGTFKDAGTMVETSIMVYKG